MEQEQNKITIPLAIVAAGALIAGAIYFGGSSPRNTATQPPNLSDIEVPSVSAKDHYLGNANAEIVVVEYSDTECPYCKIFHGTMKELVSSYGGKVAWVYRHFPIAQLHALAAKEAEATECAAELGGNEGFWKFTDMIYSTTQSNDSLDPAELPRIAGAVGLDVTAFNTCLNSGKYADKIEESIKEAVKAGARGTPYSVIMDRGGNIKGIINGAEPISSIKAKVDALLK